MSVKLTDLCDPQIMGYAWERTTAENYQRCSRCGVMERLSSGKWVPVDLRPLQRRRRSQQQPSLFEGG